MRGMEEKDTCAECGAYVDEGCGCYKGEKKKVLDVRFPKEEQEKSEKLISTLKEKKYKMTVKVNGKERYMYGNDPDSLTNYARAIGAKIVGVAKL